MANVVQPHLLQGLRLGAQGEALLSSGVAGLHHASHQLDEPVVIAVIGVHATVKDEELLARCDAIDAVIRHEPEETCIQDAFDATRAFVETTQEVSRA